MPGKLKVLISDLNLREAPGTSSKSLGYATKGVHNYTDVVKSGSYDWYHIEDGYIAYMKNYVELIDD